MNPKKKIQAQEDRRTAFDRERDEAYLSLEKERIVNVLCKAGEMKIAVKSLTDEKAFWAGVHAVRLTAIGLSPKDRKTSIDWMTKNGYGDWLEEKGIRN